MIYCTAASGVGKTIYASWSAPTAICSVRIRFISSLCSEFANAMQDDIVDICESADKQLIIESKLIDIETLWKTSAFEFGRWKTR